MIGTITSCDKEEKYLEICTCTCTYTEDVDIYTGPGKNFEKDNSKQPIKGEKLYTIETRGDWLRFRLTPEDSDWNGWIRIDQTISWDDYETLKVLEEKKRIEEENKKIAEWIKDLINGIKLYKKASISEDRFTLKIIISDDWYRFPEFQQERTLFLIGLNFVLFATEMGWVGEHLDEDKYPTVVFIDEYGKKVGINSSQGVEIYSSR